MGLPLHPPSLRSIRSIFFIVRPLPLPRRACNIPGSLFLLLKKISRNDSITRLLASRCVARNKREARLISPLTESWNFLL